MLLQPSQSVLERRLRPVIELKSGPTHRRNEPRRATDARGKLFCVEEKRLLRIHFHQTTAIPPILEVLFFSLRLFPLLHAHLGRIFGEAPVLPLTRVRF